MISESSKKTVPEFYLTSFLPINAIRGLYFLKNCMDVLLSIKQIKNVKNISFVILFTDIVHHILYAIFVFDSRHRDNVYMLQHSIVHFFT